MSELHEEGGRLELRLLVKTNRQIGKPYSGSWKSVVLNAPSSAFIAHCFVGISSALRRLSVYLTLPRSLAVSPNPWLAIVRTGHPIRLAGFLAGTLHGWSCRSVL